jgi:GTPase SAR1 family protein
MDQNLPQIKVIVVGDSGVGKSSILFRFVND